MDKKITKYFTTGEFAKLCGVNKKTLFHYDSIDLFKPEKIDNNGYRYYSHYQLEVFNIISELKEIGMSLKDIKNFIDNRSPETLIELFTKEKYEVEKEIQNLERIKKLLEIKIQSVKEGINHNEEIFLEEQKEEYLILSDHINNYNDIEVEYDLKTFIEHFKYCMKNQLNTGYSIGVMVSKENLKNKLFYEYSYYFTKTNKTEMCRSMVKKDEGIYVVGYLKGYYDKTPVLYEKMLNYIDKNNLKICGYSYEEGLIDETSIKNKNEYVIKISIKVEKNLK